jgi:hypothetical protein
VAVSGQRRWHTEEVAGGQKGTDVCRSGSRRSDALRLGETVCRIGHRTATDEAIRQILANPKRTYHLTPASPGSAMFPLLGVPHLMLSVVSHYAGAAPLALWAKSARRAAKFTQWANEPVSRLRPRQAKRRGPDRPGLSGVPGRSSVKRVERRSRSGSRASR